MQCTSPGNMRHPTTRLWLTYGCGQCTNCRIKKQSSWTLRNLLELHSARSAQFWTLTLDKQGMQSLGDSHPKAMFKTFYRRLQQYEARHNNPNQIRFYGCFELGTLSGRPHYHVLLYNLKKSLLQLPNSQHSTWAAQHTRHWPHGHVDVGHVCPASIRYVTDYMMKFETQEGPDSIPFRTTRPAIGYYGLWHLLAGTAQQSLKLPGKPAYIQIENRKYPLDQWTRNQWEILRKKMGIQYENRPEPMDRKLDALAYKIAHDGCSLTLETEFRANREFKAKWELTNVKKAQKMETIKKRAAAIQANSFPS